MTAKKILKTTGKIILYILGFVLFILIAVIIFINTGYGKRFIRDKAQAYLQNKIKTKVEIGSINYHLFSSVEIKNVYIEDQHKDTLLYGGDLSVSINMFKLISGEISIGKVDLENIKANISRTADDSNFNFQFIVNAFTDNKTPKKTSTDTSAMKISLNEFVVNDFSFTMKDNYGGNDISTVIKHLDITLNKFQPDRFIFDIDKLKTTGLNVAMVSYKTNHQVLANNTPENDTAKSATGGLQFSAKLLDLNGIDVSMDNKINGMYYGNHFQHLSVSNTAVNMAIKNASFNTIIVDSSFVKFVAPKPVENNIVKDTATTTSNASWTVALKSLQLNNDELQFDNNSTPPQKEGLDPAHIDAKNLKVNTGTIFYSADSTTAIIDQLAFNEKSGFTIDTTHARILYSGKGITAAELYIKTPRSLIQNSVKLTYDNISQLTTHPANTSVALALAHTTIAINDIYILMPAVKKYMPENKFRDNVINLNTEVSGTLKQLTIPFLQLNGLSGSSVNARATLYNVTDTVNLGYDILVYNSHILKSDMMKFAPANKNLDQLPAVINFGTHIKGDLKNTTADIQFNSTALQLYGKANIKNLKDTKHLQYDVTITKGMVTKSFITAMVPPNTLPQSIQLPDVISLTGTAKGDMNNIAPNLTLGGSYGTISAKGYVHDFKDKEHAQYDLQLSANNFAAGKLLKQQDSVLGNISMSATAKGKGFNYKTMHSSFSINVQTASIMNYPYRDINMNADMDGGQVSSTGSVNVPDLQLNYTATANVAGQYPKDVNAVINLDTVQLQKLGFYKDTLNASFVATIKAADLNPKNLNASLLIDSTKLDVRNKPYALDSITATATSTDGKHDIIIRSPFVDAHANGAFDYDKIGTSVLQYIDKYYNVTSVPHENIADQQIAFDGKIKDHPMISDLMPTLAFDSIPFKGSYSSGGGDSALNMHVIIPKLTYQVYGINNGKFDVTSSNNEIDYGLNFDRLQLSNNTFFATSVKGDLANDSLNINASTKDVNNKDWYAIGAGISQKDKSYVISLKENLLMNGDKWKVAPDNKISYSPQGILVNDFLLTNGDEKISINSKENKLNSPVAIDIENFDIEDLLSIASADTLMASGTIDAKMEVSNFDKKLPSFTGDVAVNNLQFMQQPIGDIKLSAQLQDQNTVTATLALTGNGNNLNAKGTYNLTDAQNQFDVDLNIDTLKMATLQAFSANNMSRSSGYINGKIKLNGNFTEPHWNGDVSFDTTKFTVVKTGATYRIDQQKITFAYPDISFSQFTIKDSVDNELSFDGKITAQSLTAYNMDVDINADHFILVNTPQALDNQVYGFASTTSDITIAGSTTNPVIDGDIALDPKSDVTLVLPEQNANKDAAREVVRFIDKDTFALPEKTGFSPAVETKEDVSGFLNYNLNIAISKQAALTIMVDPSSGDEIKVQGEAQLNAGVDPGGHIVLAGNYELDKGHYVLNYQFLSREFDLLQGSTIAFSGNPMDAQVDITAQYIANTSAIDLLDNEIANTDTKTANTFNQKIPFRVMLYLKGDMKKPQISFDIQLPPDSANVAISNNLRSIVENKLAQMRNDEAVTNKEVFSLLLLGHFVAEQSSDFFKSNGASTSLNEVARESVSKFLSSALNEIAADLFKGVDVDLNLNSYQDYSSGDQQQRTDLDVAVSKNFLDDRLTVIAGKNFDVEGQDAGANAVSQNAAASSFPDITINYKLSKDGKYLVRAYKKDQFDVTEDGYVTQTGAGFILTFDYDKFKELFQKDPDKKKSPKK